MRRILERSQSPMATDCTLVAVRSLIVVVPLQKGIMVIKEVVPLQKGIMVIKEVVPLQKGIMVIKKVVPLQKGVYGS